MKTSIRHIIYWIAIIAYCFAAASCNYSVRTEKYKITDSLQTISKYWVQVGNYQLKNKNIKASEAALDSSLKYSILYFDADRK